MPALLLFGSRVSGLYSRRRMAPSLAAWNRRIGACFPLAMASTVLIDQGGSRRTCTHIYAHWYLADFGYIPAAFIGVGFLGAFALSAAMGMVAARCLFIQGALSATMLLLIFAEDAALSIKWSPSCFLALLIAVVAHCILNRKERSSKRAPRLTGNLYPTPETLT